jgi:RNA 3'-phosphate cyclase
MGDLVEVDGSTGEGGGQVLRLAVAMAAATQRGVRVTKIRAGRDRPGLRAQHVTAVEAVGRLCDAETDGAEVGSRELTFVPSRRPSGNVRVDVGTAGSTTLVLQAVLGALSAPGAGATNLVVRGGTDVIMAPSWDYLSYVLVPTLGRMGMDMELSCERRGFYPKGGGTVLLSVDEGAGEMTAYDPRGSGEAKIAGSIVWSGLPDHIPQRIDHTIRKEMVGYEVGRIRKKHVEADSPGVVATLWAEGGGCVLGTSMVGRRGLPSERIGEELAREVRADLEAGATVDVHLADQLVVFTALAQGKSRLVVRELSSHARTAIDVVDTFVPLTVEEDEETGTTNLSLGPSG